MYISQILISFPSTYKKERYINMQRATNNKNFTQHIIDLLEESTNLNCFKQTMYILKIQQVKNKLNLFQLSSHGHLDIQFHFLDFSYSYFFRILNFSLVYIILYKIFIFTFQSTLKFNNLMYLFLTSFSNPLILLLNLLMQFVFFFLLIVFFVFLFG